MEAVEQVLVVTVLDHLVTIFVTMAEHLVLLGLLLGVMYMGLVGMVAQRMVVMGLI